MTRPLFFKVAADRIPIDAQHPGCVTHTPSIEDEFGDLPFDDRIAGFVGVGANECSAAVTAL